MKNGLNNSEIKPKRDSALDVAKGIGMLAVIIGHLNIGARGAALLYSFHLPLFFLISGYCFNYEESFLCFLRKKVKRYLIPYIGCAMIIVLFIALMGIIKGEGTYLALYELRSLLLQRRSFQIWFLAALFLGIIIFWFIVRFCKDDKKILLCSYGIGILFILYDTYTKRPLLWDLDTALIIQIYLGTGYIIKKKRILEKLRIHTVINMMLFGIISIFCTVVNYIACHQTYEMWSCSYGIFPLTITAAISASLAIILFSSILKQVKPLEWLGKNTMAFLAFHYTIAISLFSYIEKYFDMIFYRFGFLGTISIKMVELFFVLGLCFLLHTLLVKCKMGFILGK